MQINAYLGFDGQCEEAFLFYEKTFGGKIQGIFRYEGTPVASQVPPEWAKKIMHVTLTVEQSTIMGADAPPGQNSGPVKRICMSINLKDEARAKSLFAGLSEGGAVQMPLAPTFWAAQFGMLTDRFGIPWMINCEASAQ
jgi:PhnB protein